MIRANSISHIKDLLTQALRDGLEIGFVPTMGALHEGHISLIKRAKAENGLVVSSIFVNPTQFNDPKDLINYPRTLETDCLALEKAGCDVVFVPTVEEMYPDDSLLEMDFGPLERVMEGKFRPGHFKGVATVVSRFFKILNPDRAYFGEKDFQQLAIIREMSSRLHTGIQIIGCPTLREQDGLAMSSRNIHLTPEERSKASVIYNSLLYGATAVRQNSIDQVRKEIIERIESVAGFRVQYLEFVYSDDLQPISTWNSSRSQRACIAVLTSKTRLIDNVPL